MTRQEIFEKLNEVFSDVFDEEITVTEATTAADIDRAIQYAVGMRYASIGLLEYYDAVGFELEKAIAETGARVIILDPMQAYIGARVDMNRANEVRAILSQLGRIAEKYSCAIILVGHLNKAQGNKSNYRGLGSVDFQATARSVLVVGRVKDKPEIRVAAHQKSSLAPEGKPIAFELSEANGFRWLGHYDISIDDLLSGVSRERKSDMAESLIVDCLSDGKYLQQTLLQKAKSLGISKRVLDEAKKTLNVRSVKEGSQWYWQLPEKEYGDL